MLLRELLTSKLESDEKLSVSELLLLSRKNVSACNLNVLNRRLFSLDLIMKQSLVNRQLAIIKWLLFYVLFKDCLLGDFFFLKQLTEEVLFLVLPLIFWKFYVILFED